MLTAHIEKAEQTFEEIPDFNKLKPLHYDEMVAMQREMKLYRQLIPLMWDYRLQVADSLLEQITVKEAVEELMGEAPDRRGGYCDRDRQRDSPFYNHFTGEWGTIIHCVKSYKKEKVTKRVGGLFGGLIEDRKQVWECMLGSLSYLRVPIPFGILLKINELKKLNIFNDFLAVAPTDMFAKPVNDDPIVLAALREGYVSNNDVWWNDGKVRYYYVGRWDRNE